MFEGEAWQCLVMCGLSVAKSECLKGEAWQCLVMCGLSVGQFRESVVCDVCVCCE